MKKTDLMMSLTKPQTRWAGMKSNKFLVTLAGLALALLVAGGSAWAAGGPQKCGGATIANGPFSYTVQGPISKDFTNNPEPIDTAFTVTAPGGGLVFPAEDPGATCYQYALAEIRVFGITKVAAEVGGVLTSIPPVDVPLNSVPGDKLVKAFDIKTRKYIFHAQTPGDYKLVSVTVNHPHLDPVDFGTYVVVIKAKSIAGCLTAEESSCSGQTAGIGVGSGFHFTLTDPHDGCSDNTPPLVNIGTPIDPSILGILAIRAQADDGDGVSAFRSTLKSTDWCHAVKAPKDQTISSWTLNPNPPPAADTVTGTGSFAPTGAPTGGNFYDQAGLDLGHAFLPNLRSGIGKYLLSAEAVNQCGGTTTATREFNVNYAINFTHLQVPAGCNQSPLNGQQNNCQLQMQFTASRALPPGNVADWSDGHLMFDQTVQVDLDCTAPTGGDPTTVATHSYGTGDPKGVVTLSDTGAYKTIFSLPTSATGPWTCQAKVYFQDVDDCTAWQATTPLPISYTVNAPSGGRR